MAIGTASDFVIYDEEYYGGQYEILARNINAFNGASRNALSLISRAAKGDYEKESFIKRLSGLVTRRDTSSVAGVTALKLEMAEMISVKLNRKIGPVDQTLDAWRKISKDDKEMSFILGKMFAVDKMADFIEAAIGSTVAALKGVSALTFDASSESSPTLDSDYLAQGLALRGDRAQEIVCWVMHSKNYFDLVRNAIADKIYGESGAVVYGGIPGTLGKPVLVIDSPSLLDTMGSGETQTYRVLGLVAGAATIIESESDEIIAEKVTGLENITFRIQAEHAFNVGVKGFQWDVNNGGANPTTANLTTSTNWDKVAADNKSCAGICIKAQ